MTEWGKVAAAFAGGALQKRLDIDTSQKEEFTKRKREEAIEKKALALGAQKIKSADDVRKQGIIDKAEVRRLESPSGYSHPDYPDGLSVEKYEQLKKQGVEGFIATSEYTEAQVDGDFTLSPGQVRYDAQGDIVVKGPEKKSDSGTSSLMTMINERNALVEKHGEDHKDVIAMQEKIAGKKRPNVAKLMAEGWWPTQRTTEQFLDTIEAATIKAAENGINFTPTLVYEMEFRAYKNRATGKTAGSRLTINRGHNMAAAQEHIRDMKKASDALNYSDVKFIGLIQKWKNDQLNDPIYTEYMAQRADMLFILGNALKQNGLTDQSISIEEQAAHPTMAPKAFDAWLNTQTKALNRSSDLLNKTFGFDIPLWGASEAGTGGVGVKKISKLPKGSVEKSKNGQTYWETPNGDIIFKE